MDYIKKIEMLYNLPENKNYGIDENEIISAENNLKIKLPGILREYYLKLGKNKKINNSFNQLLKPKQTKFTDDGNYLVFCEENQGVIYWAININDMENDNPKVYSTYDQNNSNHEWYIDSETMENYLLSAAYWNGVLGGLKFTANDSNDNGYENDIIKNVENNFMEIKGITNQQVRFFSNENTEIIVLTFDLENKHNGIYVGSNNKKTFNKILEKINIEWDYRSDWD